MGAGGGAGGEHSKQHRTNVLEYTILWKPVLEGLLQEMECAGASWVPATVGSARASGDEEAIHVFLTSRQ
jgi:hypothetical protein